MTLEEIKDLHKDDSVCFHKVHVKLGDDREDAEERGQEWDEVCYLGFYYDLVAMVDYFVLEDTPEEIMKRHSWSEQEFNDAVARKAVVLLDGKYYDFIDQEYGNEWQLDKDICAIAIRPSEIISAEPVDPIDYVKSELQHGREWHQAVEKCTEESSKNTNSIVDPDDDNW